MAGTAFKGYYDIVVAIARRSILLLLSLSSETAILTSKGVPVTHEEDAAGLIGSGFFCGVNRKCTAASTSILISNKNYV